MSKNKVKNDNLEQFVILILSETVNKGRPEQCEIRTGNNDSDYWTNKKNDTPFFDEMDCSML